MEAKTQTKEKKMIPKTLQEAIEMVRSDDTGKWNIKKNKQNMEVLPNGHLRLTNNVGDSVPEEMSFSDRALTGLCAKLGAPAVYIKRLPSELQAINLNHGLKHPPKESRGPFLLRNKGNVVRAVLSADYSIIDNKDVLSIMENLVQKFDTSFKSIWLDESGFYLKMLVHGLDVDDPSKPGNFLKVGLMVGNSEVGCRSLSVEPFVYRKACTNDLVVEQENSVNIRHIYLRREELMLRTAESVNRALKSGDELAQNFVKAYEIRVDNPRDVIENLVKSRKIGQKDGDAIRLAYEVEPDQNLFGLCNALTRSAQGLEGESRIEMEKLGGRLLLEGIKKSHDRKTAFA